MGTYVFSIKVGLIFFPILALLITIPYMISQYHKYGSIPYLKSIIVYSFVLYLLEAYFMVILPLPKIALVRNYTSDWAQLIPFNFISEINKNTSLNLFNIGSIIKFLTNPLVYQLLFNIFLTVPLGIYLRYYFKRSWKEVLVFSFLLSLFFEVTQITGLYGLYPRPYRIFDVDDLISNTFGGLLGYFITPLFTFFLPSKDELDRKAIEKSSDVTVPRKLIANIIDISIIYLLFTLFADIDNILLFSFIILMYFTFSTYIFNGYTIGKKIVKIKLVGDNLKRVKLHQVLIRYQIIYIIFFEVYFLYFYFDYIVISITFILITFIIYIGTFLNLLRKKKTIYDRLSKTEHISR